MRGIRYEGQNLQSPIEVFGMCWKGGWRTATAEEWDEACARMMHPDATCDGFDDMKEVCVGGLLMKLKKPLEQLMVKCSGKLNSNLVLRGTELEGSKGRNDKKNVR